MGEASDIRDLFKKAATEKAGKSEVSVSLHTLFVVGSIALNIFNLGRGEKISKDAETELLQSKIAAGAETDRLRSDLSKITERLTQLEQKEKERVVVEVPPLEVKKGSKR
jgi:hypothetical protein